MGDNLFTLKGLGKGTKGTLESLVWDPIDYGGSVPDLNTLPRGEITLVKQPTYILIRVNDSIIPVLYCNIDMENRS